MNGAVRVRDLMTSPAVTVHATASLRDVARVLVEHGISGAPVVDGGRVVGVISMSDIVRKEDGRSTASLARDAMRSQPIVTQPTTSDHGAAWLMTQHDVGRLPVVDRGRLVGVVSRSDLLRLFVRPDSRIAAEIRAVVLEPLDVPDVDVEVDEGRVRLRGRVDREADLRCLAHAVSEVPGVLSVESHVELAPS